MQTTMTECDTEVKPNMRPFFARGLDFKFSMTDLDGESSLDLMMGKHRVLRAACHTVLHPRRTFPLLT